ncbi:MAG: hypothetical protein ACRC5C_07500 [Bacilli bacterium]
MVLKHRGMGSRGRGFGGHPTHGHHQACTCKKSNCVKEEHKRPLCHVCPDPCPPVPEKEVCDDPCLKEKIDVNVGVDVIVDECNPLHPDVKVTLDVDVIDCCKRPCACFDVDPNVHVRIIEEKPNCPTKICTSTTPIRNFTHVCR